MAVTQYQIFCRYLNETVNRALTNQTPMDWVSAAEYAELEEFYSKDGAEYESIKAQIASGKLKETQFTVQQLEIYTQGQRYDEVMDKDEKKQIAKEYCIIEPADSLYNDVNNKLQQKKLKRDLDLYDTVIEETVATNPKYDMVFMYDGLAYNEAVKADYNPPPNDDKQLPYLYYDRMKRLQLDPWFLYSTHASLNAAMTKAKELANLLGKDSVKIGKIVPLDQYIDIV